MNEPQTIYSFGRVVPPKLEQIISFFNEQAVPIAEAEEFFFYYQSMRWHNENGIPIHNWKEAAKDWLYNLEN
ncbi:hypothetical protein [Echinicola sp. 20G]|uniref:hypothetical protein n=1 Tax=Echinicola sp. 20G TaxID=2781961 RepID=UPI001910634D|nr:hypothetical protein [Echinicola sp. 20G]